MIKHHGYLVVIMKNLGIETRLPLFAQRGFGVNIQLIVAAIFGAIIIHPVNTMWIIGK